MPRKTSMPIDRYTPMIAPGMRRGQGRARSTMSKARRMWLRLSTVEVVEYNHFGDFIDTIHPDATDLRMKYKDNLSEDGDDFVLYFVKPNRKTFSIRVTDMTLPELDLFQEFLNRVIDKARPVVAVKDEIVQEGYDRYGDDTNIRLYREVPRIVTRQGSLDEHGEGVQDGPEGDDAPLQGGGDSTGGPGEHRSELVEPDEGDGGTEDNSEKDRKFARIREVGSPF